MNKTLLISLLILFKLNAQEVPSECKSLYEKGSFKKLTSTISDLENIKSNYYKGIVAKEAGDIDLAWSYWRKSNELRLLEYGPNSNEIIWNYALASNYFYETIQTDKALSYADSVQVILSRNLSNEELKKINIHKIYQILAQTIKQQVYYFNIGREESEKVYKKVFSYYKKAEKFILSNEISQFDLALNYHLQGNACVDRIHYYSNKYEDRQKVIFYLNKAEYFYEKATKTWHNQFGNNHYKLALTYMNRGLMFKYINEKWFPKSSIKEKKYLTKSIQIWKNLSLEVVPNKSDYLMAYRYLNEVSFQNISKDGFVDSGEYKKARERLNESIRIWHLMQEGKISKNKNLRLAIYQINPYRDLIKLEAQMIRQGDEPNIESLHESSHYLKHTDIKNRTKTPFVDIQKIKDSLSQGQQILNYVKVSSEEIILINYTSNHVEVELIKLDKEEVERFLESIESFSYSRFVTLSRVLYEKLMPKKINKELIISPCDGLLDFPFECLLTTSENVKKNDYRLLEYLILKSSIRYILSVSLYEAEVDFILPDLNIGTPSIPDSLSKLPFSHLFSRNHKKKFDGFLIPDSSFTLKTFTESNGILHINSHGFYNDNTFYLLLSDGYLTPSAIKKKKISADLIILNTCLSSKGKYLDGEGRNSLIRALRLNGSKGIVSTRWEVDDKASNELLSLFYDELLNNHNPGSNALNIAVRKTLNEASTSKMAAPYYWSSHSFNGKEVVVEKDSGIELGRFLLYVLVSMTVLITLGVYLKRN